MSSVDTGDPSGRSAHRARLWRRFLRTRSGPVAATGLLILVAGSGLAPVLPIHNPLRQYLTHALEPPSQQFWFGTDDLGRDLLARLLYGGRVTLLVSGIAVGVSIVLGTATGVVCGVIGGRLDLWTMHLVNAVLAFPSILLVLAIAALLGPSIPAVIVALTVLFVPRLARFARGQTLIVREHLFVEAARAAGASLRRMVARHIVPNIAATMVVEASLAVGSAALIESSISFLGAGVQPPPGELGSDGPDGLRIHVGGTLGRARSGHRHPAAHALREHAGRRPAGCLRPESQALGARLSSGGA